METDRVGVQPPAPTPGPENEKPKGESERLPMEVIVQTPFWVLRLENEESKGYVCIEQKSGESAERLPMGGGPSRKVWPWGTFVIW